MVDQIQMVTVSVSNATTPFTKDFTHSGITEAFSAAVFLFTRENTDNADKDGADIGIGFVSAESGTGASGNQAMSAFAQHSNATAPNTGFSQTVNEAISITDTTLAGTITIKGVYSSSISGGVRMNFTTFTVGAPVKVTAILFAGLSRAAADACSATTVSATELVGDTGVGNFSPDLLIFAASDTSAGTTPANSVGAHPNIGFAIKSTLAQVCAHINADDAVEPSDADGFIRSANAYGHLGGTRARQVVTVTAFPSNGFTFIADLGITVQAHYLALKFSGFARLGVANFAVAASAANQTFTDLGFTPSTILGMSTSLSAVDAALEDGALASCMGYFATGGKGSRAITWHTQEGLTIPSPNPTSIAHTRQEDVGVLQYDHTGSVVRRGTWVGPTAGGFVLNFSVASVAGFLTALGIALGHTDNNTENISDGFALGVKQASGDTERIADGHAFLLTVPRAVAETEDILDVAVLVVDVVVEPVVADTAGESYSAGSRRGRIEAAGAVAGIII
jgi:hypothetical protein